MEKKKLLNYVVAVDGVYGRNRTKKFFTFRLFRHVDPATPKELKELLPLMRAKLVEYKVKPGAKIKLSEDPIEVDGVFESFVLFSERTLVRGLLGENGNIIDPLTGCAFPRE